MTIVLIFVITAAMLLCMAAAYIKNVIIPNAGLEMTAYDLNLTSTILCKDPETGAYKVTQNLYGAENRVWVFIEEFPKNLQNAAVAIEDKRFYSHHGVDWPRTAKAVVNLFTHAESTFGGSTLTQQTIKNITGD